MASFFEKLKKGMGVEVSPEEEKPKLIKKAPGRPPLSKVAKKPKKMEIKAEEKPIEVKEPEIEKPKEGYQPASRPAKAEAPEIKVKKEKWFEPEGQLAVDVYQTESDLVIQSTIAGVKPENLDISVEADTVLIKGEREKSPEEGERNYFYQECYWGPFSRQIILPEEADPTRAEAIMKEGVLTIRIPKIERKKRKKIIVKG